MITMFHPTGTLISQTEVKSLPDFMNELGSCNQQLAINTGMCMWIVLIPSW